MFPQLWILLGQKSCRTKVPRNFSFSSRSFSPEFAPNFHDFFEDFSCFVSPETETTKNSQKNPLPFSMPNPQANTKKTFTFFWRAGKESFLLRGFPSLAFPETLVLKHVWFLVASAGPCHFVLQHTSRQFLACYFSSVCYLHSVNSQPSLRRFGIIALGKFAETSPLTSEFNTHTHKTTSPLGLTFIPRRAKPCFSKPRFSREFLHPLRCAPRTHSGSKTA